jgi:hypothetical protein
MVVERAGSEAVPTARLREVQAFLQATLFPVIHE